MDWDGYKAETDERGKFVMNKVPPGQRGLIRLIQTEANSWAHAQNIPVEVKPGETTEVTIGGTGATISGHADGQAVMAGKEGARLHGCLSTPSPRPPEGFKTPEEYRAWAELPEVKAAQQAVRNYTAEMKPDGTFSFDGVAPGQYTLNLMAMMPKPDGQRWETVQLGQTSVPVNVPETAANGTVSLELGELPLQPVPVPPIQPSGQ